jgi:Fe-S-cluster-containing dehydrogenase component/DMSO reductase anchor subunit
MSTTSTTELGLQQLLRSALREQQDLTAVEAYSVAHDRGGLNAAGSRYHELLPAQGPKPGEQYAFEVDLDRCTGCKACVTGCHNRNGLDSGETWRSVGLTVGGDDENPLLQHVTAACHHCLDPACSNGCPVRAYEKDPHTGIVRHLDDQCIGCQYCVMKCPYGVPQYNEKRGIVRKCDLCSDRLAAGEAPACVQSCPNEAIRITVVSSALDVHECRDGFAAVAGAPDAAYTRPTTRYVSHSPFAKTVVERPVELADSHPSLVVMLTLTQASVGLFVCALLSSALVEHPFAVAATLSFLLAVAGMTATAFHLGRPLLGFRAVLGLRTSWLSREAVALAGFVGLSGLFVASSLVSSEARTDLALLVAAVGVTTLYCSAKVYQDTPRAYWATRRTLVRFALSALTSGIVLTLATVARSGGSPLVVIAAAAMIAKLGFESAEVRRAAPGLRRQLRKTLALRYRLAAFAVCCLFVSPFVPGLVWFAAAVWMAGEGVERHLFFRCGVPPRMP